MRKEILLITPLVAALVLSTTTTALGRDIPKSDPDRLAILNAARPAPNAKFVVKDLVVDDGYAFLCAFVQYTDASGRVDFDMTDESYGIMLFTLRKTGGRWSILSQLDSFSRGTPSASPDSDCYVNGKKIGNKNDILNAGFPKPY